MEKVEQIKKTIVNNVHHFYCDDCNIYLGDSREYDDGYYPELGSFELSFYLPEGWYKVKKCFCEDCKQEYLETVRNMLKDMDFVTR